MVLKVKKLNPHAKIPTYANPFDAGLDIYASEQVVVEKGSIARIPTGVAIEIPEGYVGLCWDKSGLSMNHGITTLAGVIDSGFRGEVVVAVYNLGEADYTFEVGNKVAQLLIQPIVHASIEVTESLSQSARGEQGFGSSGK